MNTINYRTIEVAAQGLKALALIKFGEAKLLPGDTRLIVNDRLINSILSHFGGVPYLGGRELFYTCKVILLNSLYNCIMGYIDREELSDIHDKYKYHTKVYHYNVYRYDRQLNP